MARIGGQAAVAVERTEARAGRNATAPSRRRSAGKTAAVPVMATPAFHERSLVAEGHAAAFRIEAGGGWASGALPAGAGENEIARFLSEAIGLAKQMQSAMGQPGAAAVAQILIADPQAGASRQSAVEVSVHAASSTVVTLQPGSDADHLAAMLEHFLMR